MYYNFIAEDTNENNVSEEYLNSMEEELGIKYPDVLREFYLKHNDATLKEFSFEMCIQKQDLEFSVDFIIPMKYGNVCVEKILEFNKGNEYIPNTYMPLAEDVLSEDFYWDAASGKVFYISMGNVENPIPICNSVDEFFEILNKSCE